VRQGLCGGRQGDERDGGPEAGQGIRRRHGRGRARRGYK
jgi:hypothetical protein